MIRFGMFYIIFFWCVSISLAQFTIPEPLVATGEYAITDTIFMSPNGDDENPGTMENPVKSFQRALALLPWGSMNINSGNSYGLIMMLPGFYQTNEETFGQPIGEWKRSGLTKNVSLEGLGEVVIGGTKDQFAKNHLIRLRGNHIYIKNIRLQYTEGIGILLNNAETPFQNNVIIDNVTVDSVGNFAILAVSVDTILVRNTTAKYASRPGHENLTYPCPWPSGIKFYDCHYATIYDSEIAYTRGEGLNFHNSVYGQAFRNVLRDNSLNFYNDNSSKLQVFNNLIYNHPDTDEYYFRTCPADTTPAWSGRGILIANEGACTHGFLPSFQNCTTQCVNAPRPYPNVDSMYFYNNIVLNTGRAISFWEGVTTVIGVNCIKNVFIFNNTVVGAMGMPKAGRTGFVNFFFPNFNPLNNGNHARIENVLIANNIFSYDTKEYEQLLPYSDQFHVLHPTPNGAQFRNNLWIGSHRKFGPGDEVRSDMPVFVHPDDDIARLLTPCDDHAYWIKEGAKLFSFLDQDYLGNKRNQNSTNVGAIEYGESCITSQASDRKIVPSLTLYPNPVQQTLFVQSSKQRNGKSYQIINPQGKILQEGVIQDSSEGISVSHLPPGYYVLKIHGDQFFYANFIKI